jgi:integrase
MYLVKRKKFYHIYYRDVSGKLKTRSTKKKTKKEAMKVLHKMDSGKVPHSKLPQVTYEEFVRRYFEFAKINYSQGYVEQFKYAFRELGFEVKGKLLLQINHNNIERMVNRRRAEGKNTSTNNFIDCLKSAFNKAVEWDLIEYNPLKKIKKKKLPKNHPIFITEEEFNKLIELEKNHLAKSAYIIAFYSGCRISELLNIRWKDVDFTNNKICIKNHQHHTTKSLKQRDIPIHSRIKQVIETLPRENEFVLQGYYNRRRLSAKFKNIVKKSNHINQEMKFHGLQHSFASNLVRKGISLYIVQQLLGHSDISITQIYSHLRNDSLNETVRMLS